MPTKELVTKVWIDPGCIVCDACETAAPDVFNVTDDSCVIRPEAMADAFTKPRTEAIVEAAEECPVDVIKFEVVATQVSEEELAALEGAGEASPVETADQSAPASPAKAPEPVAAAPDPAAATPVKDTRPTAPASVADLGNPAVQALLKAATTRGGLSGIAKSTGGIISADPLKTKDPDTLPPDARYAKVLEAAKSQKKTGSTRREMLSGSTLAMFAGWGAFSGATAILIGPAAISFSMPRALEEPDPRVRVGTIKKYLEMAPGDVNEDYKPKGLWMIRPQEDRIAALNIICTHLGCIPNWLPSDRIFLCPCHGSGYYANGINFQGPTPRPLERFKIDIEDGIVVVDKSKKFQYELGQWDMPESYIEV